MKKIKKSVAGVVVLYRLLDGENNKTSSVSNAKTVAFSLPITTRTKSIKIGLSGLKNGEPT